MKNKNNPFGMSEALWRILKSLGKVPQEPLIQKGRARESWSIPLIRFDGPELSKARGTFRKRKFLN